MDSRRLNFTDVTISRNLREGRGDRPALHYEAETLSYRDLDDLTSRWGNLLLSLGVGQGDRFLIRAPNSLAYVGLFFGGMRIGAVPMAAGTNLDVQELEVVMRTGEPRVVFTTADLAAQVEEVAPGPPSSPQVLLLDSTQDDGQTLHHQTAEQPGHLEAANTAGDDPAFVIYTSGTTGSPKAVLHAHRLAMGSSEPVVHALMQLRPDDVCMQPQEISSSLFCGLIHPLYAGAQVVLYAGRFEPERAMEAVQRYGVTELIGPLGLFQSMLEIPDLEHRYRLGSIRIALSGGQPLPEDVIHATRRRFAFDLYNMMGQTEAAIYLGAQPGLPVQRGSLGRPLPGRLVSVRDEAGAEVPGGRGPGGGFPVSPLPKAGHQPTHRARPTQWEVDVVPTVASPILTRFIWSSLTPVTRPTPHWSCALPRPDVTATSLHLALCSLRD